MANPVNIYSLSRIQSEQAFNSINKHLSGQKSRIKQTEIASLRLFVDKMVSFALPIEFFDGFFYSFKIPQIGKEFDLLKLSNDYCINIEFKSTSVGYDRILKQLVQNKHYLNHLSKRIELYTVITDTMVCYKLSMENTLIEVDISEIKNALESLLQNYIINIDNLFRPADYLVSPLNTPDKFLQGEYFLTQQQEEVKGDFLKKVSCLKNAAFFHITGKPGTGKTLLLYDLAKALSTNGKTLLVHCGILSKNQVKIKDSITNLDIISAKQLKGENYELSKYSFILVDEAHRIYYPQFTRICTSVYENKQICMFSSDPGQILSRAEQRRQIVDKINQLDLSGKYELSDRIRTNKELISFMRQMIDLNDTPKEHMNYPNISLNYANDSTEARLLLNYYHNRDFIFINFSKTNYGHSPYSEYIFEEDFDTHHVIGQEFDNVVILMDNSFFYNSANTLSSISHPNPDYLYPNLFYQGITRAREKLAIIIVETPELFEKMASIVSN